MSSTANPAHIVARFGASAWLLACLLLGGSGTGGVVANGLLQIAAGALIVWLVGRGILDELDPPSRPPLMIVAAAALLGLATLVPLPPALWSVLPGRGEIADAYPLIGMAPPWLPVSLAPDATIATLLSLLPPLATFLVVLASPTQGRRATLVTLAAAALVSVLFGVAQQAGGFRSNLYIYEFTSRGGVVGFFANRNHLATLCLMTIPLVAAVAAARRGERDEARARWTLPAGALLLLVIGALAVQSRAGWLLLTPTLLASALLFRARGRGRPSRALLVGLGIVAAVAVLAALFAPASLAALGDAVGEADPRERRVIMGLSWRAALDHLPVGAGFGSFEEIYRRYEDATAVTGAFINHAHNEYLELLLETGLFGAGLLVAFLLWWAGRVRAAWRGGGGLVARAATISLAVLLAHGVVDFPGRTAAIASVAALCCALASVRDPAAEPGRRGRGRERERGVIMLGADARPAKRRGRAVVAS